MRKPDYPRHNSQTLNVSTKHYFTITAYHVLGTPLTMKKQGDIQKLLYESLS